MRCNGQHGARCQSYDPRHRTCLSGHRYQPEANRRLRPNLGPGPQDQVRANTCNPSDNVCEIKSEAQMVTLSSPLRLPALGARSTCAAISPGCRPSVPGDGRQSCVAVYASKHADRSLRKLQLHMDGTVELTGGKCILPPCAQAIPVVILASAAFRRIAHARRLTWLFFDRCLATPSMGAGDCGGSR